MTESQLEATAVPAYEAVPVDTGNYPMPDDGPQDDLEQTTSPDFDEDLVDGAGIAEQYSPRRPDRGFTHASTPVPSSQLLC